MSHVRLRLLFLRWKIEAHARLEKIRKRDWFFFLIQLVAVVYVFLWWKSPPVPGYAIGSLAALAAFMSVHVGMRSWQRIIWMSLIGAFLVIEFRAIRTDRTQYSEKEAENRIKENQQFDSIATKLTTAMNQNQAEFEETMSRYDQSSILLREIRQLNVQIANTEGARSAQDQLKREALTFSRDTLLFLNRMPPRGSLDSDPIKSDVKERGLIGEYSTRVDFTPHASAICQKLETYHLTCTYLKNPFTAIPEIRMRRIAEEIGDLAQEL